jgi:drug/metabolite transporter (DMT)-like permease
VAACLALAYAVAKLKVQAMATNQNTGADGQSWALLILLSIIWGGSFFFVGIAVNELPALLIVFARVAVAALILVPVHLILLGPLPRDRKTWIVCGGMSIFNNVLPFTAIAWGQHHIGSGLAAVINATTPIFGALLMAMAGLEGLTWRKSLALLLGLFGVVVLKGGSFGDLGPQSLGIFAVLFASACYGVSTVWSKWHLVGIPPMTLATCQLTGSSLVMALLVMLFAEPALYFQASAPTLMAVLALAALSTSIAYLIFFRIIARAGPSFVVLVTMLVPVSAIALGTLFLGEKLEFYEIAGALMIGLALVVIDGRVLKLVGFKG